MSEVDLTSTGGVYKKILRSGQEGSTPPHGADVTVHYDGFLLNGQKFDSSRDRGDPFTFKLGVGQVIEGWDLAVASMVPGEVSIFTCRADFAYGWEGKPPKIPVDATLRFEIELLDWKPGETPISELSPAEKLAHGQRKREAGTKLLKAGEHSQAVLEFSAGAESLGMLHSLMTTTAVPPTADKVEEVQVALRSCLLNLSQCFLKLEQWELVVASCTKVLDSLDAQNVKARFRRGVANMALGKLDEGLADLKAACLLDPKSKECRDAFDKAREAWAAHKEAARQAFGGMFN